MGDVNLSIGEQANLNGTALPYVVTMPTGVSTWPTPTGVRNISDTGIALTIYAAAGEFFWDAINQVQVFQFDVTLGPRDSGLFVYVDGRGWVVFTRATEVPSWFVAGASGVVSPGGREAISFTPAAISNNPTGDFTIVGGDTIQALRTMVVNFQFPSYLQMTVANNGHVDLFVEMVSVVGAAESVQVVMIDTFQSSRSGTFPRSHNLPMGKVQMAAGDQIRFELGNASTSDGDCNLANGLLMLTPQFGVTIPPPDTLVQPDGDAYWQPGTNDSYLVRG